MYLYIFGALGYFSQDTHHPITGQLSVTLEYNITSEIDMEDINSKDIIEIALVIRDELPKLLGEDSQITIQRLDILLREVKNSSDERVEDEIWDLLTDEEVIRNRVNKLIVQAEKSVSLAGDSSAIPAKQFKCPVNGCNYTWSRHNNSLAIPTCENHPNEILVLKI
jgi:hypothetical protein